MEKGGKHPNLRTSHLAPSLVTDWIEGKLSRKEAVRVAQHLDRCARCERQHRLILWFRTFTGGVRRGDRGR